MIYFLHAKKTNLVKIGYACDVGRRIKEIQSDSPDELKLLLVIRGCRRMEFKYHKCFSKTRVRGEWFQYDSRMVLASLGLAVPSKNGGRLVIRKTPLESFDVSIKEKSSRAREEAPLEPPGFCLARWNYEWCFDKKSTFHLVHPVGNIYGPSGFCIWKKHGWKESDE